MSDYTPLRNLGDLVANTKKKIAAEFTNEDIGLSSGFKRAFAAAIREGGNSIQIQKTTSVITTTAGQKIFLPNQWFLLAAYAVDLVNEIVRYRNITEAVLEANIVSYVTGTDNMVKKKQKAYDILKSENNSEPIKKFKCDLLSYLQGKGVSQEQAEKDADLLIKFVSDEAWWLGGKNISRSNDFYVSPTLGVLNLVNASQSYVATITWLYINNKQLANELATMTVVDNNADTEDDFRQEWMDKDNQEFILSCLDFMKAHGLFTDATLEILQSKEQCATKFRHNSLNGILLRVEQDLSEDEQRKDANGNARYYSEKYTISEDSYFVSSEWRPDREDARKPLIDWIFEMLQKVKFNTGYQSDYPRNRILFGAPGTGKSFTLNYEKDLLLADGGEYERVTFHPDYSYANFVGTYKPVPCKDSDGKDAITYSYVPGPFMRTYVKALQNSRTDAPEPFLLVIEEINRANVAAVFGDVFQLLDRGDDEVSEYPIQASEDIKKYLSRELGGNPDDYSEIRIPDNMFIWATMNSADQGVFPMDTAFKRRWDFTYLGIDDSEAGIVGKKVILGQGEYRRIVEWNALRKAINDELLTYKVNEDKLMGPYFISKKNLPESEMIDAAVFTRIFKNKVIMYLFDDAAKQKRITLFGGCDEKAKNQYSKICREFDTKGVYIFCEGISSQFIDNVPEDDGE